MGYRDDAWTFICSCSSYMFTSTAPGLNLLFGHHWQDRLRCGLRLQQSDVLKVLQHAEAWLVTCHGVAPLISVTCGHFARLSGVGVLVAQPSLGAGLPTFADWLRLVSSRFALHVYLPVIVAGSRVQKVVEVYADMHFANSRQFYNRNSRSFDAMSMIVTCSLLGEDLVLACGATSEVAEHLEFAVPETEQRLSVDQKAFSRRQDSEFFSCEDEVAWEKAGVAASTAVPSDPSEAMAVTKHVFSRESCLCVCVIYIYICVCVCACVL